MVPDLLRKTQPDYVASRFDVRQANYQTPDGKLHRRDVVVHPGAVIVLPLLESDNSNEPTVVLIRNERFAIGQTLWELPAGTLDVDGESPIECARRELTEEAGYEAAAVERLTMFFTCPGICTEDMHAFVASELTHVGQQTESGENITVEQRPMSQVMKMIKSGEICDGKTIATLLYYETFVREGR